MNRYKIIICMLLTTAFSLCPNFVVNVKLVDPSGKEVAEAKCEKNSDLKAKLAEFWKMKNPLYISLQLNGREINTSDDIKSDEMADGNVTVVVRIKSDSEVVKEILTDTLETNEKVEDKLGKIEIAQVFDLVSRSHKNPDNDRCFFGVRLMLQECSSLEKRRELLINLEPVFKKMIKIDHNSMYHTWFADKNPVYKNYVFEEEKRGDKTACAAYVDIEFTMQNDFRLRICRVLCDLGYNITPVGKNDEEAIPKLGPVNVAALEDAVCYSSAIQIYKKDKLVVMFSYPDLSRSAKLRFFLDHLGSIFLNPSQFFSDNMFSDK